MEGLDGRLELLQELGLRQALQGMGCTLAHPPGTVVQPRHKDMHHRGLGRPAAQALVEIAQGTDGHPAHVDIGVARGAHQGIQPRGIPQFAEKLRRDLAILPVLVSFQHFDEQRRHVRPTDTVHGQHRIAAHDPILMGMHQLDQRRHIAAGLEFGEIGRTKETEQGHQGPPGNPR